MAGREQAIADMLKAREREAKVSQPSAGYSYIDRSTGKGYEVSPIGTKKEINYGGGSSYIDTSTGKGYEVSPTGQTKEVIYSGGASPNTPQANTLTQQFKDASGEITASKDYGYVKPYQISGGQAIKQSAGNLFYNAKEFFGDRNYRDTLEPFGRSNLGFLNVGIVSAVNPFGLNLPKVVYNTKTSGVQNYEAGIEFAKAEENIVTGLNTKSSEYAIGISSSAQSEYDTNFNLAQTKVTSGEWSLESGKEYLNIVGGSIESKSKTQIETYNKQLQNEFSTAIIPIQEKYESSRKSGFNLGASGLSYGFDTGKALEKGIPLAIETGIIIASPTTGAGLIGLKEFSFGAKESDPLRMAGGLSLIGIPAGIQLAKLPKELAQAEALGSLEKQSFKFGEIRFEGATDFSIVQGTRSAGGLTQEIKVAGNVLKNDGFFMQPGSKFSSKVGGVIEPYFGGGFMGAKPQAFLGIQLGEIGTKGLSISLSENTFATFGKGNIITQFESYGTANLKPTTQSILPSKYLNQLENKGEAMVLKFSPEQWKSVDIAGMKLDSSAKAFYIKSDFSNLPNQKGLFILRGGAGEREIGHELAHYFTEGKFTKADLGIKNYWMKPSEMYANKMQDVYAKGIATKGFTFNKQELITSFGKNIKTFENKYSTDWFAGVSKKLDNNFYISRSGKITNVEFNPTRSFGKIDISREGLLIDANLKDLTLTKVIPKSGIKANIEMDFTSSGMQGLTQIPKTSFSGSSLVTQNILQESRTSLVPKIITKTSLSKSTGGFGAGLSSIQLGRIRSAYASGLSSPSLSLSSDSQFRTNTNTLTGLSSLSSNALSTSFKQPSAQMSGLSQLQLSKTDLGLKQVTPQALTFGNITPGGFGGFGGFGGWGFPPLALPSFGGGLGIVKPKRKGKRKKTKIAPSLTSSLFDLRGSLPSGGSFGITPFQLRRIPKGKNPYETKF